MQCDFCPVLLRWRWIRFSVEFSSLIIVIVHNWCNWIYFFCFLMKASTFSVSWPACDLSLHVMLLLIEDWSTIRFFIIHDVSSKNYRWRPPSSFNDAPRKQNVEEKKENYVGMSEADSRGNPTFHFTFQKVNGFSFFPFIFDGKTKTE